MLVKSIMILSLLWLLLHLLFPAKVGIKFVDFTSISIVPAMMPAN